jgi:hypothetical protein
LRDWLVLPILLSLQLVPVRSLEMVLLTMMMMTMMTMMNLVLVRVEPTLSFSESQELQLTAYEHVHHSHCCRQQHCQQGR